MPEPTPPPTLTTTLARATTGAARPGWRARHGLTLCLGLALVWVVVLRVPLVVNSRAHLDSDLAVDGLVLLDATRGHLRWHYPGTPFVGGLPVVASLPAALVAGVGPVTLVTGGVVLFGLLVVMTCWLNRRAFGTGVALWGLIPLTFASTGMIWLSGRITGGHLLAAALHAGAFALLAEGWRRGGGPRWASLLGAWLGLAWWSDLMVLATLVGVVVAVLIGGFWGAPRPRSIRRAGVSALAFLLGLGIGATPRFVGQWVDPYDSYRDQFQPVFTEDHVLHNLWILLQDCEPRLVAGHRLPALETDPVELPDGSRPTPREAVGWVLPFATILSLSLFTRGFLDLLLGRVGRVVPADEGTLLSLVRRRAIAWGLSASSLVILAGFLVAPNIEDSDNYRYLVFLLVPWSSGFGLVLRRWALGGRVARGVALTVALLFAGVMSLDAHLWYARLGWLDASGRRIVRVEPHDPARAWLWAHPEVEAIWGGYWDVYRLAFLSGGRVQGVPLPVYPDRFPEIKRRLPGGRPRTLIAPNPAETLRDHDRPGASYREQALGRGGREVCREPGLSVVDWPAVPDRRPAP